MSVNSFELSGGLVPFVAVWTCCVDSEVPERPIDVRLSSQHGRSILPHKVPS